MQFIGEDQIDHTPRDEKVRLNLGNAFDVVGAWKMTDQHVISNKLRSESFEVSLRNHKSESVTVVFVGHANGDWKIVSSSMKYTKKDSTTFEFEVPVDKNSETKVTYTVESNML